MNLGNERYCSLTRVQELLLQAVLLQGSSAIEAWKAWKSTVNIEELDPGSYRLLPLLYRNLQTHYVMDPSIGRYKGVYRQTWYKNQLLFYTISSLLRSFHEAGIKTFLLKGAALTVLYYRDYGLRPMNDFDVLVLQEQVPPALELLGKLGWEPMYFTPTEEYISVSYSHGFRNEKGQEFDLHWHVLSQSRWLNADDDFWEDAKTIDFHGVETYVLSPTDQLLHSCISGTRWDYIPPLRWVADAMSILRTSNSEIEWDRLISQAQKRYLVLPLREALDYLKSSMCAPIPTGVLQNLEKIPVRRIDRIEYRVNISPATRWTAVLDLWCQHSRLMKNTNLIRRLIRFPFFLQRIWGGSLVGLPFVGLSRLLGRWNDRTPGKA